MYYLAEVDQIAVRCTNGWGSEAILTVTSDGTGVFTPTAKTEIVAFDGLRGDAEITFMGVALSGLTLNTEDSGPQNPGEPTSVDFA